LAKSGAFAPEPVVPVAFEPGTPAAGAAGCAAVVAGRFACAEAEDNAPKISAALRAGPPVREDTNRSDDLRK
jgi:hypothetical protein